MVFDLKD